MRRSPLTPKAGRAASPAWVRTATASATVGADAAAAVQAARTPPGQIATLILPSDTSWNEGGVVAEPLPVPPTPHVRPGRRCSNAAAILRQRQADAAAAGR